MKIRRVERDDRAEWLRMRSAFWPDSADEHADEIERYFAAAPDELATFVAERSPGGGLGGLLEASVRSHAAGCSSPRVAYVEGWWVDADLRRTGVGSALIAAAEDWGRSLGLTELASDSELDNADGQAAHGAVGFDEVERVVCYRKDL